MSRKDLTCEEVIERLFVYLDKELDRQLIAEIDHHISRCRDCFTRAEFERKLRSKVVDAVNEPAPDRLHARIRTLLDQY